MSIRGFLGNLSRVNKKNHAHLYPFFKNVNFGLLRFFSILSEKRVGKYFLPLKLVTI